MAFCYKSLGLYSEALNFYQKSVNSGEDVIETQLLVNKMCKEFDVPDGSWPILKALDNVAKSVPRQFNRGKVINLSSAALTISSIPFTIITPRLPRLIARNNAIERAREEKIRDENSSIIFTHMQELSEKARSGDVKSLSQWMNAARTLISDFQSQKLFFPNDKYIKFYGYTKEARRKSFIMKTEHNSREIGLVSAKSTKASGWLIQFV